MVNKSKLWQGLVEQGLTTRDTLPEHHHGPLWLTLLTGLSGWVAAFFFLGFSVVLVEEFSRFEDKMALVVGLIYAVIARGIYSQSKGVEFLIQLGFAINLAAMLATLWGLAHYFDDPGVVYWLSGACLLALNGWFCRYGADGQLSVFGALVLLTQAFDSVKCAQWVLPVLILGLGLVNGLWQPWIRLRLWGLHPFARRLSHGMVLLVLTLPLVLDEQLLYLGTGWALAGQDGWALSIAKAASYLMFIIFCAAILRRLKVPVLGMILGTLGLTLLFSQFSGLALAMVLWLFGWLRRERLYVLLASMGALLYFSAYYYELSLTLLYKSIVLMGLGILLLSVGFILSRREAS
ncbi:DUF4401 domain-containing protein [Shewanella zhangzhouensis]|uniref:DUF4401 domain-containing protein n=1 Tax=Shewanella zhangzhouensis TaxID=2864213 RepID=UPI001C65F077|nr:DUF4401 domain-containing protein [Shewanella zhangzhouensis]QYK06723.1 DUF4401 domain-containing protein [Shewanella zhangzhouensis]